MSKEEMREELLKITGRMVTVKLADNNPHGIRLETMGTMLYMGDSIWSSQTADFKFSLENVVQITSGSIPKIILKV